MRNTTVTRIDNETNSKLLELKDIINDDLLLNLSKTQVLRMVIFEKIEKIKEENKTPSQV